MTEDVGDGSIDRQLCAYSYSTDHVPHLIDQAVGKDSPEIVLDDGKKDGEYSHDCTNPYESFSTRERPCQDIDSGLGCKSPHEYSTSYC